MIDSINEYINDVDSRESSNCWGTAVSMARSGTVGFNVDGQGSGTIPDSNRADEILQKDFAQTDSPAFGDIRRYAYPDGNKRLTDQFNEFQYNIVESGNKAGGTSHYATYLLNNGAGTIYIFSKNGSTDDSPWKLHKEREILGDRGYGIPTPIGTGSPSYKRK